MCIWRNLNLHELGQQLGQLGYTLVPLLTTATRLRPGSQPDAEKAPAAKGHPGAVICRSNMIWFRYLMIYISQCVCTSISIYIYINILKKSISISIYIYIHYLFNIHTYTHTYIHTYTHTYTHTYIHTYIYTYLCVFTCTYVYFMYMFCTGLSMIKPTMVNKNFWH